MCCPAHSDTGFECLREKKGCRSRKSTAPRLPLAKVLPGRLSFISKGPHPQLVIVTDLHKKTEMLSVCVSWPGALPHRGTGLRKAWQVHTSWKGSLSLIHLWVTAQGTGTTGPPQTREGCIGESRGPGRLHCELLLDKSLFPVPVYSPFVERTS